MKTRVLLLPLALLLAALPAVGQTHVSPVPAQIGAPRLSMQDVEVLVTPIALYPDPLVALILPASTNPSDIVLAARFLERGGTPEAAAAEQWDEAVKGLTRYREVITYLDDNLEWTRSLGQAFSVQPDDVMAAIQAVRSRARSSGLLASNAHQEVIVEETIIEIVPAQPTVIYVPRYDPEILYIARPAYYHSSFLTFGVGYHVGAWLNFDCDWRHRSVHVVHRPLDWYHRPDWRHRHYHHRPHNHVWTRWTPPVRHHRNDAYVHRPQRPVHTVMPGRQRNWDGNRQWDGRRHDRNPSVAAVQSPPVASSFHAAATPTPEPAPEIAATPRGDRSRPQNPGFDGRRFPDRNRGGTTAPSMANSFAATPPPQQSAPVATAPAQPRFERRHPGADRPQRTYDRPQPQPGVARQANAPRPNFQDHRPAVAQSQPQPPRERPNFERRHPTPPPAQVSAPPPQRPVAHVERSSPPPRASSDSSSRQQNSDRGSRSDSLERAGRTPHAY